MQNYKEKSNNSIVLIIFALRLDLFMKRILFIISILLVSASPVAAQAKWNQRYQTYVDQYKDVAIEQMLKYHIPASITLAQGLLESGAGCSKLSSHGNNHFGIKCHGWSGGSIYADDDDRNECFRAYDNAYQSYEDHSKFLVNGSRYRSLFKLNTKDYVGWARGLKQAGYATNPQYADRLIDIIQVYKLYRYDSAKTYDKFYARHTKENAPSGSLHPIYQFNDNYYLKARRGDTFQSIAQEVEISARKLARYNERDRSDRLAEGDIVYLKKKKKKAPRQYKGLLHYVRSGESMYSIAQTYGIRLKSLYKMNDLAPSYQIKVGDKLRVR